MKILDRYTGMVIDETYLPNEIQLGRYAIVNGHVYKELTNSIYKPKEGQHINQELLNPINTDKHDIFEKISQHVEEGDFSAIPMIQGIDSALETGDFIDKLEEKMIHIEAIFHDPYSKLNRSIEKVPVSKAKRISNRSNQYLAAHTEDWLHKSLVSFHPSRILTEEVVVDDNVYENQLLIAFIMRTAQYLERRISYSGVIKKFLDDYNVLMENYINNTGWYRKVRREMVLAGDVYDEEGDNYQGRKSDSETLSSTDRRLRKLRDSLLKLRQFDLFSTVDQRKVNSIQYHDTNVLVNHKHYRYLKELWFLLLESDNKNESENKENADDTIIKCIRHYGVSLVNYGVKNDEYLGYSLTGCDTQWEGTKEGQPKLSLCSTKEGIIELTIGNDNLRFIVLCGMPGKDEVIPENTYVLAYDNSSDRVVQYHDRVIPISLNDITCVEKIVTIIRQTMLKLYLTNTVFKNFDFPLMLTPFVFDIAKHIDCLVFNVEKHVYTFEYYPNLNVNTKALENSVSSNPAFKSKNRFDQQTIITALDKFVQDYENNALQMSEELKCFDIECGSPVNFRMESKLNYIECSCGFVVDSTDVNHVKFYKRHVDFSPEQMGMDYIEIALKI